MSKYLLRLLSDCSHASLGWAVAIVLLMSVGCNKPPESQVENPADIGSGSQEPVSGAQMLAAGRNPDVGTSTFGPTAADAIEPKQETFSPDEYSGAAASMPPIASYPNPPNQGIVGSGEEPVTATPFQMADPSEARVDPTAPPQREQKQQQRELRPDLSPKELALFLAEADEFMRAIYAGETEVTNREDADREMTRAAKLKLVAAKRLLDHPDSDAESRSTGARGVLQALSHLAAKGDLKSADELQAMATSNLESDDERLVAESRIVLIGFAIESLQNGVKDAPEQLVDLVSGITQNENTPDVPALMVMGEARHLLSLYGHDDQAILVRQHILDLFANSPNPEIAKMAAQAAGNVRFDGIEKLRVMVVKGKTVDVNRWRDAMSQLITEAPDLATAQYLAGAALEFEAVSEDELVAATYDVLSERFPDETESTGRVVKLATTAFEYRQKVIGRPFDPDLPRVDGTPMPIEKFQGKVILMPFWAMQFPESLQLVELLRSVAKANPDEVVIVGMNLDPRGADVEGFVEQMKLGFDSYRSETDSTASVQNPVADRFGMVSMPFVAILDQDGRVVALDFTGKKIEPTVDRLLAK